MGGGSRYKDRSGKELSGNEAVVAWLADNNKNREVTIMTYLYGTSPKAKQVMNKIARDHGGKARLIGPNE